MPPRPSLRLRPILFSTQKWKCLPSLRVRIHASSFHSTTHRCSDSTTNHYETLHLTQNASSDDIKRQFYALSKKYHPDRNPDDPTASTRFVAISEAYHLLSVPEKRAQYDAQLESSQARGFRWGRTAAASPQGSYSSASFGSRPASGLNKKRSTFRGPPPSFFKTGGYGQQGAKRAEHANYDPNTEGQAGAESYGEGGGLGPGQQKQGNQVPHFNDKRHKETHENLSEHIKARRRQAMKAFRLEEEYNRGGMLMNFMILSGVLGVIGTTTIYFGDHHNAQNNGRRKEDLKA